MLNIFLLHLCNIAHNFCRNITGVSKELVSFRTYSDKYNDNCLEVGESTRSVESLVKFVVFHCYNGLPIYATFIYVVANMLIYLLSCFKLF